MGTSRSISTRSAPGWAILARRCAATRLNNRTAMRSSRTPITLSPAARLLMGFCIGLSVPTGTAISRYLAESYGLRHPAMMIGIGIVAPLLLMLFVILLFHLRARTACAPLANDTACWHPVCRDPHLSMLDDLRISPLQLARSAPPSQRLCGGHCLIPTRIRAISLC